MYIFLPTEFHCCPAVSRNYGGKTKEIIIIIIYIPIYIFSLIIKRRYLILAFNLNLAEYMIFFH